VPSNYVLERIGTRKTLTRITFLWGVISMGMMFGRTPMQFYVMRFLLGGRSGHWSSWSINAIPRYVVGSWIDLGDHSPRPPTDPDVRD
jgi:hypothetical protein